MDSHSLQPQKLNAGQAFSETFNGIGSSYLIILLAGLLFGVIAFVLQLIPYIGPIIYVLVLPPLTAGFALLALDAVDNGYVEFGTLFYGFGRFASVFGAGCLMAIPYVVFYVVILTIVFAFGAFGQIPANGQVEPLFLVIMIGLICIFLVVSFFVAMYFFFTYYLIMDREMGAIEAVKTSFRAGNLNFGHGLLMVFFYWLFFFVGLILCYIGLLFTMPFAAYFGACCYRQVFPKEMTDSPYSNAPPTPDQYGSILR